MICLVDMEHEQAAQRRASAATQATEAHSTHQSYMKDIQRRLEETSQDQCVVRPYTEVTREWLNAVGIEALILSGNVTEWHVYDEAILRELGEIVRSAFLPILGLCGGLQFIAMTHGAQVGPIRKLKSDEDDVGDSFGPGFFKEWGFTPIQVMRPDPLFDGVDSPVFLEAHYWEVKAVPEGFELLASTDVCRIQALRRVNALVYGTQFHPEAYVAEPADRRNWLIELVYPEGYAGKQMDGRTLLTNFFQAAGLLPP